MPSNLLLSHGPSVTRIFLRYWLLLHSGDNCSQNLVYLVAGRLTNYENLSGEF